MKLPANTVQTSIASPQGRLLLAASADRLVGVWFDNQAHLPDLSPCASAPDHPVLTQAAAELAQYFAGQRQTFEVPLNTTTGTLFVRALMRMRRRRSSPLRPGRLTSRVVTRGW